MALVQELQLSEVNSSSAKVGSWLVRVAFPYIDEFAFQDKNGKQVTGQKFICTLVGVGDAQYMPGVVKGTAAKVKQALDKFREGTLWKLSKIALDTKSDAKYVSGPLKNTILLSQPTQVDPILAGVPEDKIVPRRPVPISTLSNIIALTGKKHVDIIGLVFEVGSSDVVATSIGERVRTNVVLIDDGCDPSGAMRKVQITVWEEKNPKNKSLVSELQSKIGKVVVFHSIVGELREQNLQLNTGKHVFMHFPEEGKRAVKLTELSESITAKARTSSKALTSWGSAAGAGPIDVTGDATISCCAALQALRSSPEEAEPTLVVQLHAVQVDIPVEDIVAAGTDRIFFVTQMRDYSGQASVAVIETGALALSGIASKEQFTARFHANDIAFPLVNIRCLRKVKAKSANSSSEASVDLLLADAVPFRLTAPLKHSTKEALLAMLAHVGRNNEGLLPAAIRNLTACPHYGLLVAYNEHSQRSAKKALCLVRGVSKSLLSSVGSGKRVTTDVQDVMDSEPKTIKAVSICHEDNLLDFKIDRRLVLLSVTGINVLPSATGVEHQEGEQIVVFTDAVYDVNDSGDDRRAAEVMQSMMQLSAEFPLSTSFKRKELLDMSTPSPTGPKRCRSLAKFPSAS